jgi:hypothetical protein
VTLVRLQALAGNRRVCAPVACPQQDWENIVKYLSLIAIACALAACEYRHETTVQPQPAAATIVTPAPPATAVVTTPAPATSTTVYTR